ncbi:winged helix-turn-helix domain-containing protein [Vibrio aquaticus]|nr:winged helix-turn-helix domain-containing protein [Vibrio aquaticus]
MKKMIDELSLPIGSCRLERSESGAQVILENEKAFSITLPESCILQKLSENKGEVITKHDLIVAAWGRPEIIGSNSLPVAITNLRKVLEISNIKITNVPRRGYKIDIPEAEEVADVEPTREHVALAPLEQRNHGLEQVKVYGALLTLLFSAYAAIYTTFSWVKVECQQYGEATICSIQGEQPSREQVVGKAGRFYYSDQSGLMEVSHGSRS